MNERRTYHVYSLQGTGSKEKEEKQLSYSLVRGNRGWDKKKVMFGENSPLKPEEYSNNYFLLIKYITQGKHEIQLQCSG